MGESTSGPIADGYPRVAAFFDFDSTIVKGDSIIPFTRFLIRRHFPTLPQMLRIGWSVFLHRARVNSNDDVKRDFVRQFQGHTVEEVEAVCREFCDTSLSPIVYPQARERIESHRKKGHRVVICSASLTVYLTMFGKQLGADTVIGTDLQQRNGVYTGRLATANCIKEEKLNRLRAMFGFRDINIAESYAYSDHIYDLPMLAMVGHPVLVNPEPRLRKVGHLRAWPIEKWSL
jgi:HAD superfamily hydrolase (TIGR01490 family)